MKRKGWIITIATASLIVGSGSAIAANTFSSNISKEKAKEIALQAVPGTVKEIDMELKRGKIVYEMEIAKSDSYDEVEVQVDADSGKVISTKKDDEDDDDDDGRNAGAISSGNAITKEQAVHSALTAVSGEVLKVESDSDDGIQQYEVKIKTNKGISEVDVAAVGGKVLSIGHDDDDDDDDDDNDDD